MGEKWWTGAILSPLFSQWPPEKASRACITLAHCSAVGFVVGA